MFDWLFRRKKKLYDPNHKHLMSEEKQMCAGWEVYVCTVEGCNAAAFVKTKDAVDWHN